jgi:hypothetical protein
LRPELEQYYLIDRYLENKLTGEELISFENQLSQDAQFLKRVEEQRMINDFILEAELKSVREQIEADLAGIQNPSFFRMHWKWITAGIFLMAGILYFSLLNKKSIYPSQEAHLHQSIRSSQSTSLKTIRGADKTKEFTPVEKVTVHKTNSSSIIHAGIGDEIRTTADSVSNSPTIESVINRETVLNSDTEKEINTKKENKTHDCSRTEISCSMTTETSCSNARTGSISIEKISGGLEPYSLSLNNKKIKEKNISELGAGVYTLKITDKNGCYKECQAIVSEKNCISAIQQGSKFNINPAIGETCSIPFDDNKRGTLIIYNRSGKIVYRDTNPDKDYVEWNGADGYGALAEPGLYVYIIEYEDGTKITGEVNIMR